VTGVLLHELLAASADRRPDHPAVVDRSTTSSYRELADHAARISAVLTSWGVGRGDRVALWLDKSAAAVAAIYGVLRTGAAYVPVDPGAPVERVAYVLRDCAISTAITDGKKLPRWRELAAEGVPVQRLVILDGSRPDAPDDDDPLGSMTTTWGTEVDAATPVSPADGIGADDLAYILYTSGSTGRPKGVMLSHRNGASFVDWAARELGVTEDDRLSSHAPFHFDLSIFDLYAAAQRGATSVLVPRSVTMFPAEGIRFIDDQEITVWYSVPSVLSMMVSRGGLAAGALRSLRLLLFAGEVFPTPFLSRFMELVPHADYWNLYGPTETNVCTAYRVRSAPEPGAPPVPIGTVIDGDRLAVVDDAGGPVAPGDEGELLVTGDTVTSGYWGDPDRTAERLAVAPGVEPGTIWYRTGDRVVETPTGDLVFVGRRDHQVKSRGYRIELGEIETVLHRHPDVSDCAVVAVPDELVTNRIVAAVAPGSLDPGDLARHCEQFLPAYMVPQQWHLLDELPHTSTGKVDRVGLTSLGAGTT
jgi:amino acid adenylation domain-containing protein